LRETRHGLRRLYCLAEKNELRGQVAWLPGLDQWKLCAATLCGARQLEQMLEELIADRAFLEDGGIPRSTAEFEQRRKTGRQRIGLAVQDVMRLVRPLLEAYHQVALALEDADPDRWPESVEDVRSQLAALTAGPFLVRTPWHWLEQFPRYFQAIRVRLYKLVHTGAIRDRQLLTQIGPFWESYRQRQADHDRRGLCDPELEHFRWLLEEFRVSLFAQELGTRHSVSARRLERQWEKVQV
jgi:ATP-dependent helicase HrpA